MNRQRGFTLLELLVALAIFALIGAAAYSGLASVLATRQALAADSARLQQLQLAFGWLRRDIEQAAPRPVRDSTGSEQPALLGNDHDGTVLELTRDGRDNPLNLPRSALERLGYRLQDGRLLRLSWPVLDGAAADAVQTSRLLDQVESLQFRFLDGTGRWLDHWPPASDSPLARLPRAIELQLTVSGWGRLRRLFLLPEGAGLD